jgi:predicted CXXCH cytochrome family protein
MRPLPRLPKNLLLFGGIACWAVFLVSCVVGNRPLFNTPFVEGASIVGSQSCAKCHSNITRGLHDATHAHLTMKADDGSTKNVSCESCHGPGSRHIKAGTRDTIINPKISPDTCIQCHVNTRSEFSLPHTHPVLAGKISCTSCHDPHVGDANPTTGGTKNLAASVNATCAKCHPAQTGPYVFEHEVMREGCTMCHSPHGSVNDKMLKSRNVSLCYQCHFQPQNSTTQIMHGGVDHSNNVIRGPCWTAGCHEAIHGSNVNSNLRY